MAGNQTRFAAWLAVAMDNKGYSGRKLAKLLGNHDTSVSKWKAGEAVPTVSTLIKMAQVFDVPPQRLLATARPDEFDPKNFGEPLPVPSKLAYRKRVAEYIRNLPIDDRDARELEELFAITQLMREGLDGDEQLNKAIQALRSLRRVVDRSTGEIHDR